MRDSSTAPNVADVVEALQAGNRGLTIATGVIAYPSAEKAEAALAAFQEAHITAVQDKEARDRISVVYGSILTNVVARVVVVTGGRVVPKPSATKTA